MPKFKWEEMNSIIHNCKGALEKAYKIEIAARKLREEISEELENLNSIILEQVNDNKNGEIT